MLRDQRKYIRHLGSEATLDFIDFATAQTAKYSAVGKKYHSCENYNSHVRTCYKKVTYCFRGFATPMTLEMGIRP